MLYDRWRQVAHQYRGELALMDRLSGRHWTFEQIARLGEQAGVESGRLLCPQSEAPEFVFDVVRGWRGERVVCPLEGGQSVPRFETLPPGVVHLKQTSASTGPGRFVGFTAAQLVADADQIVATMGLRPDWPNLGVISLAHSYGFSNLILPLLLHGIPLILAGSPLPEPLRRATSPVQDVTLPAVPALWRAWREAGCIPSQVRLAISAGAPLPLPLELAVHAEAGLKIHNFYGATECGGIAFDASPTPRPDGSCAGQPMQGVAVSLNDEGCLRVRSQAAGEGYWPEPDTALAGGCYQTSDLARLEGGQVFLDGRRTDLIHVAGRKVSPEEIERALAVHPDVRECVVFGAPSADPDRTEFIVACVAVRSAPDSGALKRHLLSQLPGWQIPRDWWFVPELETNRRGKLARREWRERYLTRAG